MTWGHLVIPSHKEGTAQSSWTLACKTTLHVSRGTVTKFSCKDQISTQKQDNQHWVCLPAEGGGGGNSDSRSLNLAGS